MNLLTISLMIAQTGQSLGIPQGLLSALCYVESNHRPAVVNEQDNGSPSVGLCQIKFKTAKLMGYKGDEKGLLDPKRNVFYAGKYLKKQLTRYNNDTRKAVAAYNAGTYIPAKTHPGAVNQKYVDKVFKAWGQNK